MPSLPDRRCGSPGCRNLQPCSQHQRAYDKQRGSPSERGYDGKWRKYRGWFIGQVQCSACGRNHRLCEECQRNGRLVPAYAVDHIKPYQQGDDFYDHSNHQGLCQSCHARKSQGERHGEGGQNR